MGMIAEYLMIDEETLQSLLKLDSEELSDELFDIEESEKFRSIDIDKLWDVLHYFLTGVSASDPIEGDKLSEAVVGVHNFHLDPDADFITYTKNEELNAIIIALDQIDFKKQAEVFDLIALQQNEIYPKGIWEENRTELLEELELALKNSIEFYKSALVTKHHVIVSIL